jgi:hypothetical protein
MHAPIEKKSDDLKHRFYEELDYVSEHFPKYHVNILLRNFNAKLKEGDILKSTTGNEKLHQESNNNGFRIVKIATSKYLLRVRNSCTETAKNASGPVLMENLTTRLITH